MKLFDLSGKVAIVTGGNGGIGLGMARGLAGAGAAVVVAGRDQDKSKAAVNELEGLGVKALALAVDVTSEESCKALVQQSVERLGRLDILVNNAGTNIRKQPQEYALAEWHMILETNLTSAFMCCQAAYPAMLQAGGGKIINIGSMMSIFGASFTAPYAATKGGIVQLTRALACAWAKDGIQVNAILPGWIDTALTRAGAADHQPACTSASRRARRPRAGARPDDFAGIAVWLSERGLGLRHRHRDPGRRRLLGAGLSGSAARPLGRGIPPPTAGWPESADSLCGARSHASRCPSPVSASAGGAAPSRARRRAAPRAAPAPGGWRCGRARGRTRARGCRS